VHGFFGRARIRLRQDGQAVVEERDLLRGPDDLQLPVPRIQRLDQIERLPGLLLGKAVESGQKRRDNDGRRQKSVFTPSRPQPEKNGDRDCGSDQGRALPVREARDEPEVDEQSGRGSSGRFQDIDRCRAAAMMAGVEGEPVAERKAQEQADQEGESQGRPESRQLGRQDAQQPMGGPQQDQAGEERDDGQAVEPGQSGVARAGPSPRPDQAADASAEEPGAQEEPEGELVAIELGREFPEEVDLESRRQKAEKERRQPGPQAQRPGIGVPHVAHLPLLSRTSSML